MPGDGAQTLYEYDTRGNMTKQTMVMDPADASKNLVTEYEYTPDGKLARMTGPEGNVTRYEYDTRGRVVKRIDAAGNLVEKIDAKDQKTEYFYDDGGRLEQR